MIDMRRHIIRLAKEAMQTARFQQNSDGQFFGKVKIEGEILDCWLVFDPHWLPITHSAFLSLSFERPE